MRLHSESVDLGIRYDVVGRADLVVPTSYRIRCSILGSTGLQPIVVDWCWEGTAV
jgi:hypothetical protein